MRNSTTTLIAIAIAITTVSCQRSGSGYADVDTSVISANKALQRQIFDTVISGDMDALDDLYAPDVVYHGPSGEQMNLAGMKASNSAYMQAFPDAQVRFDIQIAEGEYVAARAIFTGTQTGDMEGIPATGKSVTVSLTNIQRIVNGRIVEEWEDADLLGMMTQLEILPGMD